jgi:hypothetical protein
MSSSFLVAPIGIRALHLEDKKDYLAVEPMANFRHLPYFDPSYTLPNPTQPSISEIKGRDVYAGTPYISENIVSPPFQNRNLRLPPGIHLHWELPKALRTGKQKEQDLSFPTVPNRWLVIRKRGQIREQKWIIESDYLWPEISGIAETDRVPNSICIPYPPDPSRGKHQPFRYLGRKILLSDWLADNKDCEYWGKSFTAIGYGEPTFSAFYPNCYSVFGCHDAEPRNLTSDLSYEIVGWHSQIDFDYIRSLILNDFSDENNSSLSLNEFIQKNTNWKLEADLGTAVLNFSLKLQIIIILKIIHVVSF